MHWLEMDCPREKSPVSKEATGNNGEGLTIFLHEAGHTVSMVNPVRIKGFAQGELVDREPDLKQKRNCCYPFLASGKSLLLLSWPKCITWRDFITSPAHNLLKDVPP
jgi:hypothetical protein